VAAVENIQPVGRAQAKWLRFSARKGRLVLDLIRGRTVPEARTILAFSPRHAARDIEKVLRSAVANAEVADPTVNADELVVHAAYADEGPTLKRWRPRARGRVNRINKRTCHVTVVLAAAPEEQPRPRRRQATGGGEAAATPRKARTPRKKKEVAA
jgi:large subunit ribosomal protein L22